MKEKPLVSISVLGESRYREMFTTRAELELESETRRYQFSTSLASISRARACLLVYGATQTISPRLKSLLLFANCFSSEMVVLLVDCAKNKSEDSLDKMESNLRRNLTEQGFDGNSATILRSASTPTQTDQEQMLRALDERDLIEEKPRQPKDLPDVHPNRDFALLLLRLQQMIRPATILMPKESTTEELFQLPISTQLGGSPYLEINEEWPVCQVCPAKPKLKFLWQIDARAHLVPTEPRLGLFVFYFCDHRLHQEGADSFHCKHYLSPSKEKRHYIKKETKSKLRNHSKPTPPMSFSASHNNVLPHNRQLQEQHEPLWKILSQSLPTQKKTSNKAKNEEEFYLQLAAQLGASQARFNEYSTAVQVGGYCELPALATYPRCPTCKEGMLCLATVHLMSLFLFAEDMWGFNFLVCPCDPTKIEILYAETYRRYNE
jgi:hypothetical protein